jgi:hypothetical protein
MPLFDQVVREELRPMGQNEGVFEYLNRSARPGIAAMRDLLDAWFMHVQESAKADVRGRFRARDDAQHQSAFFELFWHELLRCSGHEIEVHPVVPGAGTNPDFMVRCRGAAPFYVEATLAMPPVDAAAARRMAELHDVLDRMYSPDYFIEIQYRGIPEDNIGGRAVRNKLESWMQELNFEEICRLYQENNYRAVPSLSWTEASVCLTFTPIPKGPESRGNPGFRPVGINAPMEGRMIHTHDDIRAAIEGKATRYGDLQAPLVVAVNVMDDFCDDRDIWDALLGEGAVLIQADGGRRDQGRGVGNGAWRGRAGPRSALVSAVVITHQLSPSNLRTCLVELIHNPWATHALPADSLPLAQHVVGLATGVVERREGEDAAQILGIPDPWPVPD